MCETQIYSEIYSVYTSQQITNIKFDWYILVENHKVAIFVNSLSSQWCVQVFNPLTSKKAFFTGLVVYN